MDNELTSDKLICGQDVFKICFAYDSLSFTIIYVILNWSLVFIRK